jgi:hypothetical protein
MTNNEFKLAVEAMNNAKADVKAFTKGSQFYGAFQGCDKHGYDRDSLEGDIYIAIFLRHLNDKFANGEVPTNQNGIIQ